MLAQNLNLDDILKTMREVKSIGEDQKRLINETEKLVAQQEKSRDQELQSRLSLETAKVQELTQAKGNYLDNNFRKFCLLTWMLNI